MKTNQLISSLLISTLLAFGCNFPDYDLPTQNINQNDRQDINQNGTDKSDPWKFRDAEVSTFNHSGTMDFNQCGIGIVEFEMHYQWVHPKHKGAILNLKGTLKYPNGEVSIIHENLNIHSKGEPGTHLTRNIRIVTPKAIGIAAQINIQIVMGDFSDIMITETCL